MSGPSANEVIPAGDNLDRGRSPYPNPNPSSDTGGDGMISGSCKVLKSTDHVLDDSFRSIDRNGNSCSLSDPNPDPRPMARVARRLGRLVTTPSMTRGLL